MNRNFPKLMEDENHQIYLTLLTTSSTQSWLDTVTWDEYQKQGRQEIQLFCKGIAIRPRTRYSAVAVRARYWNSVFKAMKKITLKLYNYPNNQLIMWFKRDQ